MIRGNFYKNLEIISRLCNKYNKKFWTFYLATEHDPYPSPKLSDLRFEIFSALAFGSQCVQSFTYWQPSDYGQYVFRNAPMNVEGEPTPVYGIVKSVNEDVQKLSSIFLGMKVESVGFIGAELPEGIEYFKNYPDGIKIIEVGGKGILVSKFTTGTEQFLLIVNYDIENPQIVNFKFQNIMSSTDTGVGVSLKEQYQSKKFILEPGGNIILEL